MGDKMKDKRLDIFFEHCSFRLCKYFSKGECSKWYVGIAVVGRISTKVTNCNGDIAKCELED